MSLMSSIFGNNGGGESNEHEEISTTTFKKKKKKMKKAKVNNTEPPKNNKNNTMDLFSSKSASYLQVSQQRQEEIRKKQRKAAAAQMQKAGQRMSPSDILQRRRKRTETTGELVASVTVDVPQYFCEEPEDSSDNEEDADQVMQGIARLLVGRSGVLFREQGVLILKSLLFSKPFTEKKNKKKSIQHHSPLIKEMQSKAQEVERQICKRLNEKLGEVSYRPPPKEDKEQSILIGVPKKDASFRFVEVASRCLGRLDIRHGMNEAPFTNLHLPCELGNHTANGNKRYDNNVVKLLWPLVQDLLGKDAELVYMGLICSFPGSEDQPWHQDGTTLFPDAPSDLTNSLPPYALNVFIPLLDVSEELGPTEFWLGSHATDQAHEFLSRQQDHPGRRDPDDNDGNDNNDKPPIIGPLLSVGDALIYDYRICHRGTSNLSKTKTTRPMLYLMYARPWFKEHLNFGTEHLF